MAVIVDFRRATYYIYNNMYNYNKYTILFYPFVIIEIILFGFVV